MLSIWGPVLVAALVGILVVLVPGYIVAWSLRLPPLWRFGLAPAMTMLVMATSSAVAWLADGFWSWKWICGGTVVWAVVCMAVSRSIGRSRWGGMRLLKPVVAVPQRSSWIALGQYALGAVVTGMVMAPLFLRSFGGPDHFLQKFDNAFHLNATAWIHNTGQGFSPQLEWMVSSSVYPLGWHQFNATVWSLSGVGLTGSTLAGFLVGALVIWPLTGALLVESAIKPTMAARMATGPLSMAFMAFPYVTVETGGIYANFFGLSMAGALLACLIQLAQVGEEVHLSPLVALVSGLLVLVGVAWAHPNAAMLMAAMSVPALATSVYLVHKGNDFRDGADASVNPVLGARMWTVTVVSLVVMLTAAWVVLAPSLDVAPWGPFESIPQSIGEVLFATSMSKQAIWTGALLTMAGAWVAIKKGKDLAWVLLVHAVCVGFYVVSAAFGVSVVRNLITGVFYNDARRTASALSIGSLLLSVIALRAIVSRAQMLARRKGSRLRWLARKEFVVSVALMLVVVGSVRATRSLNSQMEVTRTTYAFQTRGDYNILSREERTMLSKLRDVVQDDAVVANNPLDGSGLMYAFEGVTPLNYYMFQNRTEQVEYLNHHLKRAADDPEVCRIVEELRVTHVLVMDPEMLGNYDFREDYPGMGVRGTTKGFTQVIRTPRTALYEITACQ